MLIRQSLVGSNIHHNQSLQCVTNVTNLDKFDHVRILVKKVSEKHTGWLRKVKLKAKLQNDSTFTIAFDFDILVHA